MARKIRAEEMRAVRTALASAPKMKRSRAEMEQDVRDHLRGASAQPAAPHDKHMTTARQMVNELFYGAQISDKEAYAKVATALAQAEREGMRRAAEIARKRAQEWRDTASSQFGREKANEAQAIVGAILFEAGETD